MVLGCLLLALCFSLATDSPVAARIDGHAYGCEDVIGPGELVSGQPTRRASVRGKLSPAERRLDARVAAACAPLERAAQVITWSGFALGGLLLLAGWTTQREEEDAEPAREPQPSR